MFRRRTDQVYATLQQVQRRITEQAGAPGNGAEATPVASPSLPTAALQDVLTRSRSQPPLVAHQPEPPPLPASLAAPPKGTVFLSISKSFAVTLIVLWLASDVGFFVLGGHANDRHDPGAGTAPGLSGERHLADDANPAAVVGGYVLVLESVATPTPEAESRLASQAQNLNKVMSANASLGWKPWFGVRHPENGELQLVFGETSPGTFGVPRQNWEEFARVMTQPPPRGAGYPGAHWLALR